MGGISGEIGPPMDYQRALMSGAERSISKSFPKCDAYTIGDLLYPFATHPEGGVPEGHAP